MKYNLSKIMHKSWELFRKLGIAFSECLHRAWAAARAEPVNAALIAEAKAAAGITEETNTWSRRKKNRSPIWREKSKYHSITGPAGSHRRGLFA